MKCHKAKVFPAKRCLTYFCNGLCEMLNDMRSLIEISALNSYETFNTLHGRFVNMLFSLCIFRNFRICVR